MWIRAPGPRPGYGLFTAFFSLSVLGVVIAFFEGNWGIARGFSRELFQMWALGTVTYMFCRTPERVQRIFFLYYLSFLYYGLWGLASLIHTPLAAGENPGARHIVYWHMVYDNRDGFGPLMVAGLAISVYYVQATKIPRWSAISTFLLAALGIFTSFGRGVFLALGAAIIPVWLRSKRKMTSLLVAVLLVGVVPLAVPQLADQYVETMRSMFSEGTKEGTGGDRATLWSWAVREWKMDPVFGVGTGNFGIAVFKVVTPEEAKKAGYAPGRLWGRSLHSAPMTVLCEYGSVGMLVWLGLLVDFLRTNRITRKRGEAPQTDGPAAGLPTNFLKYMSLGLQTAFIAIVISSIFYEFLYTSLFWHVFIMNRLLYHASGGPAQNVPRRKFSAVRPQ